LNELIARFSFLVLLCGCLLAAVDGGRAHGQPPAAALAVPEPSGPARPVFRAADLAGGAGAVAPAPAVASTAPASAVDDGAQADQAITAPAPPRRSGWVFLPGITYTPDRGLSASAAALRYFRLDQDPRASRMILTVDAGVSGRGQVSLDPDVWFDGRRYNLAGTVWVSYLDYAYFGIGNGTDMAEREDFTALRFTARPELIRRITRALFAGALYEARYEDLVEVDAGGDLATGMAPGSSGGLVSGVGAILRWDSRDHSFSPRSGGVATLSPRVYQSWMGSAFDFTRLILEASWFFSLGGDHVLALDGRIDLHGGDAPFSHMSQAGGRRLLRGMLDGRFRDQHFAGGQVEYRYPLFWRFGGVLFGGLGRVAHTISDFQLSGLKYSAGGGLRFTIQKDERITVRFDVGKSNDDSAFYFALLEAF
jgi:hypothetical protein